MIIFFSSFTRPVFHFHNHFYSYRHIKMNALYSTIQYNTDNGCHWYSREEFETMSLYYTMMFFSSFCNGPILDMSSQNTCQFFFFYRCYVYLLRFWLPLSVWIDYYYKAVVKENSKCLLMSSSYNHLQVWIMCLIHRYICIKCLQNYPIHFLIKLFR